MNSIEYLYLECQCSLPAHRLVFQLDLFDPKYPSITAEVHLTPLPFWKRLVSAVKYLFGYRSRFGEFDDFLMKHEDLYKLQNLMDAYTDARTGVLTVEARELQDKGNT